MIPVLETERLVLRPFEIKDAKAVQLLASDYDIYKTTLHIPHPYEEGMAEAWIGRQPEDATERHLLHWAIVDKKEAAILGCVSIGMSPKRRIGEIGYWLGKPYWNKGFGTEAGKKVMAYGFEALDLNRIYGRHFAENPASGKIMEKCGMKFEGLLRADQIKEGKFVDICYWGVLKSEWMGL